MIHRYAPRFVILCQGQVIAEHADLHQAARDQTERTSLAELGTDFYVAEIRIRTRASRYVARSYISAGTERDTVGEWWDGVKAELGLRGRAAFDAIAKFFARIEA